MPQIPRLNPSDEWPLRLFPCKRQITDATTYDLPHKLMRKRIDRSNTFPYCSPHRSETRFRASKGASGDPGTLFTQFRISAAGSASASSALYKFPAPCQLWNWPWLHMQPREVAQPPDATPVAAAGREMTPADAQRDRTTKDSLTVQPSPPWQVTEARKTDDSSVRLKRGAPGGIH